jgi:hypothetical protein
MASLQPSRDEAPLGRITPRRFTPSRFAATRFASVAGLLMLGGCAGTSDYPSLQRWPSAPVQQASGQMAVPSAPAQVHSHVAPGCDAAAADAVDAEFRAALPAVEASVKEASTTTPGTPTWSKGNIALASLQQIRTRLGQLLAPAIEAYTADTIDHAQDDARDGVAPRPDGAALATCHAHISDLTTNEDTQIDRLHALLPD